MTPKTLLTTAAAAALAAVSFASLAAEPAGPATRPAAAPATLPALPEVKVPENITGAELALRAQQAFNRGEYAAALPLYRKLAAESEGLPAKLASIQERIRVCEKAIAAAKAEAADMAAKGIDPNAALKPKAADNSAEARKPHVTPAAGQVYDTTIQGLGNFDYDQDRGGNVPEDVQKLSGSVVRLKGFMIPMDAAENITQFALVPSLFACCFGQPPSIQHTIVVNCPKGKAVGYSADELIVEGTLKVQEKKDDGYIISLFEMQVQSVKLAPKQ
ncbi:MAG TPA: DUF3299 domain-containing protein [Humisphaera sp.]